MNDTVGKRELRVYDTNYGWWAHNGKLALLAPTKAEAVQIIRDHDPDDYEIVEVKPIFPRLAVR